MTEEEKKAQLEAEQSEEQSTEQDAENSNDESQENGSDTENEIDYKAIAEKERLAREKAEKTTADIAFKLREEKRKKEEGFENEDEEKPLSKSDLQVILEQQNQRFENILSADKVSEITKEIALSPEEAEAIIETYKNRQFPSTLSLREKLLEAQAIVNAPKLKAINSELARSLKAKGGVNYNPQSAQQEALPGGEAKIPVDIKNSLKQQGFSFNQKTHRFEKEVNNRTLIYDDKTKKILAA